MNKYSETFGLLKALVKDIKASGNAISRNLTLYHGSSPAYIPSGKRIHIPKVFDEAKKVFVSSPETKAMGGPMKTLLHESGHAFDKSLKEVDGTIKGHPLGDLGDEFTANSNAIKWLQNHKASSNYINKYRQSMNKGIKSYKQNSILNESERLLSTTEMSNLETRVNKVIDSRPDAFGNMMDVNDVGWRVLKRDPKVKKVISHLSRKNRQLHYGPEGPVNVHGNPVMANI